MGKLKEVIVLNDNGLSPSEPNESVYRCNSYSDINNNTFNNNPNGLSPNEPNDSEYRCYSYSNINNNDNERLIKNKKGFYTSSLY